MRRITIRQFHTKMWEEIKDLPLMVTKYNEEVFTVMPKNSKKISEVIPNPIQPVKLTTAPIETCTWEKVIGGTRFYCHNPKVEGKEVCETHDQ